jgi:mitogen-activated protein kinase kinase 1
VQSLDITVSQKDRLESFLKCREKIGDLTNDDLCVDGELGSGNGGVVLKVKHRKTLTVMAKKVIFFKFHQMCLNCRSFVEFCHSSSYTWK